MDDEDQAQWPDSALSWQDLTSPEKFMLWAVRVWIRIAADPMQASQFMTAAFDGAGVEAGGVCFHRFMCSLTLGARRRIGIRCPRSVVLLEDERALLAALAYVQAGCEREARIVLGDYVKPGALDSVAGYARILMQACSMGGVLIRPHAAPAEGLHRDVQYGIGAGGNFVPGNTSLH